MDLGVGHLGVGQIEVDESNDANSSPSLVACHSA